LVAYKAGKRPVPTKMQPKLDQVQPADFDALAAYYGSFK
jgi:cytochrome c553